MNNSNLSREAGMAGGTPDNAGVSGAAPLAVAAPLGAAPGKYLTFQLDREEFGIGVLQVREIMALQDITAVPQMPDYVKGVINLRGKVIPVMCLRARFGLPAIAYGPRTSIVVVDVRGQAGPMQVGIVVDGVSEVLNVALSEIEPTPDFGGGAAPSYLLGMAKSKDRVKILLDIDQVASAAEIEALRKAPGAVEARAAGPAGTNLHEGTLHDRVQ